MQRRFLLAGLVFAAVAGGGASITLREPVYEATSQVIVTPLSAEEAPVGMPVLRDLGDPIRTIETAAALLHTRPAAELTAERLGEPWTPDSVYEAITATPQGQTNLVDVTARASSAGIAASLANTYTTSALDLRSQALTTASTAALTAATEQVASNPEGSAAESAAQERLTKLELLRTYGDPSAVEAQSAVAPLDAAGLPAPVVLALSLVAGLLAAIAVAVMTTVDRPRAVAGERRTSTPVPPRGHPARARQPVGAASVSGEVDGI